MFRKKNYLALGAVTLLALLILSLPPRVTAHLKLAIGSLFLPLFGLANTTQQLPADLADSVLPRRELLQQIDRLVAEETGLPVHLADDPMSAVAEGTGRVLQEIEFLKRVATNAKY